MIICGAMAKWSIYIIFSSHFHFLHALSTLQIRRSSFFFSFIPNSSMKGGGVEIKNIGCTPINAIHTPQAAPSLSRLTHSNSNVERAQLGQYRAKIRPFCWVFTEAPAD
mmetsp:Transcript_25561/g.64143  ORF Transcript_25561/g.64143 Transcript_25561/m.64143 type:complete len:109 (+) Transcript_25561:1158-1484(+)